MQSLVELIQTGETRSRTLDARLIVRESCDLTEEQIQKLADHCAAEEIVGMIFNKYIGDLESSDKDQIHSAGVGTADERISGSLQP